MKRALAHLAKVAHNVDGTFDGGVVLVHEVALDELDGEGGLSDTWGAAKLAGLGHQRNAELTTTADDDELVLSEELCLRLTRLAR